MKFCRNATSHRSERQERLRRTRRTAGSRPHARLPEGGLVPSQGPMPRGRTQPEAPGSPRPWRVRRCGRRAGPYRICSRSPGGMPARARPLVPGGFATWRTSPIKGRSDPARAHSSLRSPRVRHCLPLAPPPVNDPSAPSYDPVTSPTPRLDPVEVQTTPCCAAIPRASPERTPPQPPSPGTAERARQRHPCPVSGLKPTRGEFMVTSPPFLTRPGFPRTESRILAPRW
jgi:hypothetical protein